MLNTVAPESLCSNKITHEDFHDVKHGIAHQQSEARDKLFSCLHIIWSPLGDRQWRDRTEEGRVAGERGTGWLPPYEKHLLMTYMHR